MYYIAHIYIVSKLHTAQGEGPVTRDQLTTLWPCWTYSLTSIIQGQTGHDLSQDAVPSQQWAGSYVTTYMVYTSGVEPTGGRVTSGIHIRGRTHGAE